MADIRINALPTTASASSSDDYIALDGTTNGTRKLNAYSPTFGGNLTVSGTASAGTITDGYITISAAQINRTSNFVELQYAASGGVRMFGATATPITFSSAGNLTVSGTGTSSFAGAVTIANTASTSSYQTGLRLQSTAGSAPNTIQALEFYSSSLSTAVGAIDALREAGSFASSLRFYSTTSGGALTERGRFNSSGNLLIGTTTDSGQKLQVAGTVYFSGDLYSNTAGSTWGADSGATGFLVYGAGGGANANKLVLRTNSTTALTVDASQNATFAGNLTVSGTGTSSFAGNLTLSTSGSRIATGTSDGTDNKYISFSGGGAAANTRGSSVYVTGNEFTTGNAKGSLQLEAGYDATMSNTMDGSVLFSTGGTAVVGYFNRLGNLILGPAAADGGNGKLQLATHSTSAGGIGFGTDTSLYRYDFTTLALKQNSGANKTLYFYADATNCGVFDTPAAGANYSGIYFNSTANSATIATRSTIALTLDASQNATFAGTIAIGQYTTAGAPAYAKGKLYFDVTLNKLRVGGATGWETVTSV